MGLMTAGGGLTNSKLALATLSPNSALDGKTFYAGDKTLKVGTMPNLGAWSTTIDPGKSVTIPWGCHSGAGIVTSNDKTIVVFMNDPNSGGTDSYGRLYIKCLCITNNRLVEQKTYKATQGGSVTFHGIRVYYKGLDSSDYGAVYLYAVNNCYQLVSSGLSRLNAGSYVRWAAAHETEKNNGYMSAFIV